MPCGTTFFSFFLKTFFLPEVCCCFAIVYFLPGAFFLAIVARRGPLRVRALVWVRWPRTGRLLRWCNARSRPVSITRVLARSTAIPQPPVTADVHHTLDVQLNRLTQIAFDVALRVHYRANAVQFLFGQLADFLMNIDLSLVENAGRARFANAVYVCQSDL